MSNFYISDTHFGHSNIIKHCNRPFDTADIMDRTIIRNWNSVVTDRDTVYLLGDIVFSKGAKEPAEYLSKLKGKKIAVVGNHDYDISRNREKYLENKLLEDICNYLEIKEIVDGASRKVVMSHYPIVEWNGFFRGSIQLYGHIHNSIENAAFKIMSNIENAYNVSADILDFTPRTLEDVIKYNQIFKEKLLE